MLNTSIYEHIDETKKTINPTKSVLTVEVINVNNVNEETLSFLICIN